MGPITIEVVEAAGWERWRGLRRAALAEAPDAFCSTLAEWSGEGDNEDRWRARLEGVAHNVVAVLDGRDAGMVSATAPVAGDVELVSMWVAPEARGKGVGDALVTHVLGWARQAGAERVVLEVRAHNAPGVALYARHGFVDVGAGRGPGSTDPDRRMAVALGVRSR